MSMTKKGAKKPTNKPQIRCGKGRTKQEFTALVDINNIVARYRRTGQLDHINENTPQFGDVSNLPNFQNALQIVINAKTHFASLPSKIRTRFDNNAERMLEFLDNPENREEAEKLGMVKKKNEPTKETKPAETPKKELHRSKDTGTEPKDHKKNSGN